MSDVLVRNPIPVTLLLLLMSFFLFRVAAVFAFRDGGLGGKSRWRRCEGGKRGVLGCSCRRLHQLARAVASNNFSVAQLRRLGSCKCGQAASDAGSNLVSLILSTDPYLVRIDVTPMKAPLAILFLLRL